MDISFKTRQLYPHEQRLLKTLKKKKDKESGSKIKYYHFFIAGLLAISFTYLANINKESFWVLPLGTIVIFAYSFIIFMPYEIYKSRKNFKIFANELNSFIAIGTVETCIINAKRIAVSKEFEDEGELFIIEYDTDKVLYLWDYDYNLKMKFPCLDFEIYEEKFLKLFSRQVYPLSEPINPLIIDKKAKWNYMSKIGAPGNLQTQNISFDKLIEEYNSFA
ncbi:hypothetical protein [Ferruginibacter sp.]